MLDRGGEIFFEEVREDFGEAGAKTFVFGRPMTESDAERAGEGFGGEGFIESAGEELVEGRILRWVGGPGVELVGL